MNQGRAFIAEFIGTFILVFFGIGAVHAAVLTKAQTGIWQAAIIWAIIVALSNNKIGDSYCCISTPRLPSFPSIVHTACAQLKSRTTVVEQNEDTIGSIT